MTAPSSTLYFRNLDDKVRKGEMKRCLFLLCSQFGNLVEVNVSRAEGCRGQAFVVFSDVKTATEARKSLGDLVLHGKQVKVFYSRTPSFSIAPGERRLRDIRNARSTESGVGKKRERENNEE